MSFLCRNWLRRAGPGGKQRRTGALLVPKIKLI